MQGGADWLACHTQDEIAERIGMARETVRDVLAGIRNCRFPPKPDDLRD